MFIKRFLIVIFLLIFVLNIQLSAAYQDLRLEKDIVLATVNDEPVTLLDVVADRAVELRKLSLKYSGKELEKQRNLVKYKAVQDIINRKLIYAEFKKNGYKLPLQVEERMLDRLAANLAGGDRKLLETKARRAGMTIDELREQARERAATDILINARSRDVVYITPKEVYEYYEKHKKEMSQPPKIKIQVIFFKTLFNDKTIANFAKELKERLKQGDEKTFELYVKKYSQGPNKDGGGKIGWVNETELRPEFSLFLKGRNKGEIAGPIITKEGIYIARIIDRKEAVYKKFDDLKKDIRDKLTKEAEQKAYASFVKRLRKSAFIRILYEPSESIKKNQ